MRQNLNVNYSSNIHEHFPFETIRETQRLSLDAIQETFRSPKKYFILEGPTGYGKSGVGIATGAWAKTLSGADQYMAGAHILSPQKTLTKQYMNDFGSMGLIELKGQANYTCCQRFQNMDCESAQLVFGDEHNSKTCTGYKPAKRAYQNSPLGVTNFSYFLQEMRHVGQLGKRRMLVLDEGHNTENQVLGFTDTVIKERHIVEYNIPGGLPTFDDGDNNKVIFWLRHTFVPAASQHQRILQVQAREAENKNDVQRCAKLKRAADALDKFLLRLGFFTNSETPLDWFCWSDAKTNDLTIKPLTATLFADDILFSKAEKILIMSATILDFGTFMRNLGINPDDAEVMAVNSEFPLENRPIFYAPVGNMRRHEKEATLPEMAKMLAMLMRKYSDKKGIVHTHSYANNKYFVDYLMSEGFGGRIVTHQNGKDRDLTVLQHYSRKDEPTVLFSPSMTEGLDLKDEFSRFQVITKTPYPALDPYMRARMQRDKQWYEWLTGLTLVQATGRSVRSKTDKAHTWILDGGFGDFLQRAGRRLPRWWTDSIIFK